MKSQKLKIIWNRKGFLLRDFIISTILLTGIIALGIISFTNLAIDYNNTDIIDTRFQKYDKFINATSKAEALTALVSETEGLKPIGTANLIFQGVLSVFQLIIGAIPLLVTITGSFFEDFGFSTQISNIVATMFLTIITVIIVFVIFSSTTRRDI